MPRGMNAPKLWPALPVNLRWIVSSGRPFGAVLLRHFAADDGADDAVDVADGQVGVDALAAFDGRLANVEQPRHVQRLFQAVVLVNLAVTADFRPGLRADAESA